MKLDRERLIFIHLPKTAGTTITHYLSSQFAHHEICPGRTMVDFRSLSQEELGQFKFIKGHIFYSHMSEQLRSSSHLITILRDPVDRVISLYNFWRDHPDSFLADSNIHGDLKQGPRLAKGLSLLEFAASDHPVIRQDAWNAQSRQLARFHIPGKDQNPETAKRVIDTLGTFDGVGTVERMPFFVLLLQSTFQISSWFAVEPMNVAKVSKEAYWKDSDEKHEIRRLINQNNVIDRIVYDWALRRNEKEVSDLFQSLISGDVRSRLHLALLYRMFLGRWPSQKEIDIQITRGLRFEGFFNRVLKSREFNGILKHLHGAKDV